MLVPRLYPGISILNNAKLSVWPRALARPRALGCSCKLHDQTVLRPSLGRPVVPQVYPRWHSGRGKMGGPSYKLLKKDGAA
jgi:hypothetical protein